MASHIAICWNTGEKSDPAEKSHSTPALVHPTPATRADAKDQSPWKSQLSLHQTLTKTLWTSLHLGSKYPKRNNRRTSKRGRKEGLLSSTFLFRIQVIHGFFLHLSLHSIINWYHLSLVVNLHLSLLSLPDTTWFTPNHWTTLHGTGTGTSIWSSSAGRFFMACGEGTAVPRILPPLCDVLAIRQKYNQCISIWAIRFASSFLAVSSYLRCHQNMNPLQIVETLRMFMALGAVRCFPAELVSSLQIFFRGQLSVSDKKRYEVAWFWRACIGFNMFSTCFQLP